MCLGLEAIQQVFQKKITQIKMFCFQTGYHNQCLRLENPSLINAVMLYSLILKMEEQNIRKITKREKKVGKIRQT